jgi:hypothetical protein
MRKKTNFEQVPLEVVKRVVDLVVDLKTGDRQIIELDGAQKSADSRRTEADGGDMSDSELKYPEWQAPLQELILEFDREKLPGKMQNVGILISKRLQQLRDEMDGFAEVRR